MNMNPNQKEYTKYSHKPLQKPPKPQSTPCNLSDY